MQLLQPHARSDNAEGHAVEAIQFLTLSQTQRAQGKLPVGAFGEIEFETNRVQVEELAKEIAIFQWASEQPDVEVNIESLDVLGEGKNGSIGRLADSSLSIGFSIAIRSGKIRAQDYLGSLD